MKFYLLCMLFLVATGCKNMLNFKDEVCLLSAGNNNISEYAFVLHRGEVFFLIKNTGIKAMTIRSSNIRIYSTEDELISLKGVDEIFLGYGSSKKIRVSLNYADMTRLVSKVVVTYAGQRKAVWKVNEKIEKYEGPPLDDDYIQEIPRQIKNR